MRVPHFLYCNKTIYPEKIKKRLFYRSFIYSAQGLGIGLHLRPIPVDCFFQCLLIDLVCFKVQYDNSIRLQNGTVNHTL